MGPDIAFYFIVSLSHAAEIHLVAVVAGFQAPTAFHVVSIVVASYAEVNS